MRYVLQRKVDGKFDRGREVVYGKRWTDDLNKAFLYQTEVSARGLNLRHLDDDCSCGGSKKTYWKRRHTKNCTLRLAAIAKFNETYEILPVKLVVVK